MRKLLAICSVCLASACGFAPMHAPVDAGAPARDVYIAPISGTNGIDLRNALRAKFGADDESRAKYLLSVDLKVPSTVYKGLQITGDAAWQEVRLTAKYELKDAAGGKVVLDASDTSSESYAFVRDLVASQASYNNAVQSSIRILAEKIETRIGAKLAGKSGE
jgi:hypothetical protein